MRFAVRRPAPPLDRLVQMLWFYEGYVKPHARERLLPDGSMELVVNLSEDAVRVWDRKDTSRCERLEGAALIGPHSDYFVIDTDEQSDVMGVHFRPGGAFPFLGLPVEELHGLHVSLSEVWGGFARELRERLLAVKGVEARFDLLEAALLRELRRPPALHPAVRFAVREFRWGGRVVADVCAETGLSARRFIALFRQQVGMAPKRYCRVRRFQRIVHGVQESAEVDWSGVAVAAGYSDQSHLIHEFQALAGISPGMWAELKGEHRNHVPMVQPGQISTIPGTHGTGKMAS